DRNVTGVQTWARPISSPSRWAPARQGGRHPFRVGPAARRRGEPTGWAGTSAGRVGGSPSGWPTGADGAGRPVGRSGEHALEPVRPGLLGGFPVHVVVDVVADR